VQDKPTAFGDAFLPKHLQLIVIAVFFVI